MYKPNLQKYKAWTKSLGFCLNLKGSSQGKVFFYILQFYMTFTLGLLATVACKEEQIVSLLMKS